MDISRNIYRGVKEFLLDDRGSIDLNTVGLLLSGAGFFLTAAALYQGFRSTKQTLEKIDRKSCLTLGAAYLAAKGEHFDTPEEYVQKVREASRLWRDEI